MNFFEYQSLAKETDQNPIDDNSLNSIIVPFLGLAGEAGQLLTEYKKHLRDGESHMLYKERVSEELGDLLWYISNIASKFELNLDQIAKNNINKTKSRWRKLERRTHNFDSGFPENECLPRKFYAEFCENEVDDRKIATVKIRRTRYGDVLHEEFGDPLTDNAYDSDGYRFHDVFHFAYAAVLGWSPVVRKFLSCKRKSEPDIDEVEDGARARVIEEGISAIVFEYARNHKFFENIVRIDSQLLRLVKEITSNLEVSICTQNQWERAILEGFRVWRLVLMQRKGVIFVDLVNQNIEYLGEET